MITVAGAMELIHAQRPVWLMEVWPDEEIRHMESIGYDCYRYAVRGGSIHQVHKGPGDNFHIFFLAAPNVIIAEKRARQITLPLEPVLVPMVLTLLTPNLALMLLAWDHVAKLWQFFDLPRGTCISLINMVYSGGSSGGSNHRTDGDDSLQMAARDKQYVVARNGHICSLPTQDVLQWYR